MQGGMLDKHKLSLQLSMRKPVAAVKGSKQAAAPEKQGTKLVVRNVAFEATRKEIMSLFSPFGHMKSCRLPRKFDGTPRSACIATNGSTGRFRTHASQLGTTCMVAGDNIHHYRTNALQLVRRYI